MVRCEVARSVVPKARLQCRVHVCIVAVLWQMWSFRERYLHVSVHQQPLPILGEELSFSG